MLNSAVRNVQLPWRSSTPLTAPTRRTLRYGSAVRASIFPPSAPVCESACLAGRMSSTIRPPRRGDLPLLTPLLDSGERIAVVILVEAEVVPGRDHVRWQWRRHIDPATARMRHDQPRGMQVKLIRHPGPGQERAWPAILAVAQDRRTDRLHMNAKLMSATGQWPERHEGGLLVGMLDHLIEADRALAVLIVHGDPLATAGRLLGERSIDLALERPRHA